MAAPINSIKHYVPTASLVVATGAILNKKLVNAIVAPAITSSFSVIQGAVIKAIYIEYWLSSNEAIGSETQFVLTIEKKREQEPDMTHTQSLNLGSYPNKKNIFYITQGIVTSSQSVPVIRQYVLLPKGKQRFGLEDELMANIAAVGGLQVCGISTYKEYR